MSVLRAIALSVAIFSATLFLTLSALIVAQEVQREEALLSTTTSNTLDSVYQATVKVRRHDGEWEGSGIEGTYRGMYGVLTAAHVVDKLGEYDVVAERSPYGDVTTTQGMVVALDPENDLAWLMVSWRRTVPDLTPAHNIQLGEATWYCGVGASTAKWLEQSIVARPYWKPRCPYAFMGLLVTGKGFYGSSGGPVFVKRHERLVLAGIMSQWATDSQRCWGFSPLAAVGPDSVAKFLDRVVRDHGCPH